MEMRLSDNIGNGSVIPYMATPVAGSGATLTNASADTNTTVTVEAGATYVFTALEVVTATTLARHGAFLFSITGTVATAANIEWACPGGTSIMIKIPEGVTVLNYATDVDDGTGYLRKVLINE